MIFQTKVGRKQNDHIVTKTPSFKAHKWQNVLIHFGSQYNSYSISLYPCFGEHLQKHKLIFIRNSLDVSFTTFVHSI